MSAVSVVGGIYGEECSFPVRKQIFGSAGRAAAALSPHFDKVTLHTTFASEVADRIGAIFDAFGVDVERHGGSQFISFEYLHCLADPQIHPRLAKIEQQAPFEVHGDLVVQFGMIECRPTIVADICVYDPQSPTAPLPFTSSGSKARSLAIVANAGEIELLTGMSVDQGARHLVESEKRRSCCGEMWAPGGQGVWGEW